jgi:hypothetical protein
MRYLILPTAEADRLNNETAVSRGAKWEGAKAWAEDKTETETALFISDDSELTQAQIDLCVDVLPERFIPEIDEQGNLVT